jgi:hypothetical protein
MTAELELLARCRAARITLVAGPDGCLIWEADTDPPTELLAALAALKPRVLTLLRQQEDERFICDAIAADLGLPPKSLELWMPVRSGETR